MGLFIIIITYLSRFFYPLKVLANRLTLRQWIKRTKGLIQKLDAVERIPLLWPVAGPLLAQEHLLRKVQSALAEINTYPVTLTLLRARTELTWKYLALIYRLRQSSSIQPTIYQQYFQMVSDLALQWQQKHPLHSSPALHLKDLAQFKLLAHYPEFIELLLVDSAFCDYFFKWILQDHNPVEPFVQYPASQELLVQSNLSGRLQKANPSALRIFTSGQEKYLGLLIEGRYANMLELEEHVVLRGKWVISLREIFNVFSVKSHIAGNLEFFTAGITNWNANKLGYWSEEIKDHITIDVNAPEWWKQLPILESLEKNAVRQRYGFAADGKHWIVAATATRGTPTLDYDNSHAFLEVAIPLQDGRYGIYDFGKVATFIPKTTMDTLIIFADSIHATVAYPDDNAYYTHRQRAQHSFPLTRSQAACLMGHIRNDILKSRTNNFIYQIESENCAQWVQTTLEKVFGVNKVPNMFVMPLIESEPQSGMRAFFSFLKLFPRNLPSKLLIALHVPLGAWRGKWIVEEGKKVWKALNKHPFWDTGLVYLPALLHKQRRGGSLSIVNGGTDGALLRTYQLKITQEEYSHSTNSPKPGYVPYHVRQVSINHFSPFQYQLSLKLSKALTKAYVSKSVIAWLARGPTMPLCNRQKASLPVLLD